MAHEEWKHIKDHALSPKRAPGWPGNVKAISMEGLSLLGLDPDLNLYWDGSLIEMKRPLHLTLWQKFGATVTVASAAIAAIATAYSTYLAALKTVSCS